MRADSDSFSHTPKPAKPPTTALPPQVVAGLRRYLSTKEACAYLGCHKRTIDRLIECGRLKTFFLGRTRKFLPEDLDGALVPVNPEEKNPKNKAAVADFVNKQTKR
jgi:excisionase family DNA binding protein